MPGRRDITIYIQIQPMLRLNLPKHSQQPFHRLIQIQPMLRLNEYPAIATHDEPHRNSNTTNVKVKPTVTFS